MRLDSPFDPPRAVSFRVTARVSPGLTRSQEAESVILQGKSKI
jgi:hypothetical protein